MKEWMLRAEKKVIVSSVLEQNTKHGDGDYTECLLAH